MKRSAAIVILSFLFVPTLGVIDQLSGSVLSLTVFYLIPIALVVWYGGLGLGIVAAALALGAWGAANLAFPVHIEVDPSVELAWDMVEKLLFFAICIVATSKMSGLFQQERLRAHTDFITGLPNRRAFAAALAKARGAGRPFSLSFLEFEGLDEVAMERGELYAEKLFRELALQCGKRVTSYRYSDNRLAILLPEDTGSTAVGRISLLIAAVDSEGLSRRGFDLQFKVGIAYCENAAKASPPHLVRFLSEHMVRIRTRAGDQLEFFQFC